MDLETSLKLLKTMIENCKFTEIGFAEAKRPLDKTDVLDIIIQESVEHWQFQELDNMLAAYNDVEMKFDSGNDYVRIFRKEAVSS